MILFARTTPQVSGAIRQFVHTVGARLVQTVLAAVTAVVLARALQPDGRGAFYVISTIALMALTLGHLSVEQAQIVLWATSKRGIAANTLLLGPAIGALAAGCAALIVVVLGPTLVPVHSYALLALALASVPFAMALQYMDSVLVLRGRTQFVYNAKAAAAAIQCGGLMLLAVLGWLSVTAVVVLWFVFMVSPLLVELPAVRPRLKTIDLRLAARSVRFGLRYHVGFAALFLLMRQDALILNALSTTAAVGLYAVAVTFTELSKIATDVVAQVILPEQAKRELAGAVAVTIRATQVSVLLALVAVGGLCLVAPVLIPLVCGPAFVHSVPAVFSLAPGLFAWGATRSIGTHLVRLERPIRLNAITAAATVLNAGLNLVLIPAWGIAGCGLASSIAYAFLAALQTAWFVRATGTPLRRLVAMPTTALRRRPAAEPEPKRITAGS